MAKHQSLPTELKSIIKKPTYPARPSTQHPGVILPPGRAAIPKPGPDAVNLRKLFKEIEKDAVQRGIGWGEWVNIVTATIVTLNSPTSIQELHRFVTPSFLPIEQRFSRACLMREVGLKCIGFVGIPTVINQLAALRSIVDQDKALSDALPQTTRRDTNENNLKRVQKAGSDLWNDIYDPLSKRLLSILGHSHPDLPYFVIQNEYGPLFAPPSVYSETKEQGEFEWEVNRLRTSLVAMAGLRAQGGVGPQLTSHIWGILKSANSITKDDKHRNGLLWLASQDGAIWILSIIDNVCETIEGDEGQEKQKSKM